MLTLLEDATSVHVCVCFEGRGGGGGDGSGGEVMPPSSKAILKLTPTIRARARHTAAVWNLAYRSRFLFMWWGLSNYEMEKRGLFVEKFNIF